MNDFRNDLRYDHRGEPSSPSDRRPDKKKFWLLRFLTGLLLLCGLLAVAYGLAVGALAYYGTKNGSETGRIVDALAGVVVAVVGGVLTMAIGQVFRVILAIEENTRMLAYLARMRPVPPPGPPMAGVGGGRPAPPLRKVNTPMGEL